MELSVFGGSGFIGSQYIKDWGCKHKNERGDYQVYSKDVLYFISTVDNYNVLTNPTLDINTNLLTLMSPLENWRLRPDSKDGVFNFISSWFVYGDQEKPHGVPETAVCNPKGFYSITKRCAEQLLQSYCETYGLNYRILRLSNVVGPGDKKVSAKKNALQYMLGQLARGEDVKVYGYNGGRFHRDYMHVLDCSSALHTVLEKGDLNTVYNVGNGLTWNFVDIINYSHIALRSTSKVSLVEPKEFHKTVQTPSFYLNVDKLKRLGHISKYLNHDLYDSLIDYARTQL